MSFSPATTSVGTRTLGRWSLALVHVERRAGDVLWLRYRVAQLP
ncbi:MAG TPA: hypothetical protein VIR81_10065 [Myxococcales bacterium]